MSRNFDFLSALNFNLTKFLQINFDFESQIGTSFFLQTYSVGAAAGDPHPLSPQAAPACKSLVKHL